MCMCWNLAVGLGFAGVNFAGIAFAGVKTTKSSHGVFVRRTIEKIRWRLLQSIHFLARAIPPIMGGHLSVELLFWIPTVVDLLLLAYTYASCRRGGPQWYFDSLETHKPNPPKYGTNKKNDDANTGTGDGGGGSPRVDQVWQLAMAAYSAYACVFPWAVYQCAVIPELRVSFCGAMTVLMLLKLDNFSTMGASALKESNLSLLLFNLPTYGGYVLAKLLSCSSDS